MIPSPLRGEGQGGGGYRSLVLGEIGFPPSLCIVRARVRFIFLLLMIGALASGAQEPSSATPEASLTQCPPDMVSIEGRYCIDRYEFHGRQGEVPFAGITWLEAAAQCKAAGKRLCSGPEWERACSGPSKRTYPYGDAFEVQRCNSGREHTRGATPSGYHPDCKSEEGVYDLSGNLWEWTGLQAQQATLAGGSWMTDGDNSKCSSRSWQGVPNASNFTYGFRCCASLIPGATE